MEKNYQKRIEKISQAIYLVSNHLKDNEPLKWELRKESIGFLSCIRSLDDSGEASDLPADIIIDALGTYAKELTSLLSLAVVAGLISKTNGTIVTQEIELLMASFGQLEESDTKRPGYILSHDFFATDPEIQDELSQRISKGQASVLLDKGATLFNDKLPFLQPQKNTKNVASENSPENKATREHEIKDRKDDRQAKILTLLRAQSNLSIKDFAAVIPDCSEKTIQRELLELVEKGVIKKEGERRWSTYSLK
jgi:hypothetical protein